MKSFPFLLLLLFITLAGRAQDTLSARDKNLMQVLQMNGQAYSVFARVMRDNQQRTLSIHKDSTMPFAQKKAALEKLHLEKQAYISGHLTLEQQRSLDAYYKSQERHSPAYYKRQEQLETLKARRATTSGS